MKMHPLVVIGVVAASAVAGYHFRSGFPMPVGADAGNDVREAAEEPATPQLRRTLAAIEAENEIRRAIEEKESAQAAGQPAEPDPEPVVVERFSAAPFHDELAAHGEWLEADGYGEVWQPEYAHDSDWRPYADGGWAHTEAGWTWDSDEPCGDITCHYGRWVNLTECGWCWVPGYDWAPAWVSWRCSDEVIGWAPLPPCVPWRPAAGLGPWVDACGDLGPGSYCFVPIRHFAAANCRPVLCGRAESVSHFCHTRNVTRLICKPGEGGRSRPVLEGPDVHRIAALCPQDLRHRRLQVAGSSDGRVATRADRETLLVRQIAVSAAAGVSRGPGKASRRIEHVALASPWKGAGDPEVLAAARRQVFAEAHETFRGLPRLVAPVAAAKPAGGRRQPEADKPARPSKLESVRANPHETAAVAPPARSFQISEATRSAASEVVTSPAKLRTVRESGSESSRMAARQTPEPALVAAKLEPASRVAPRQLTGNLPLPQPTEPGSARAARDQNAVEALRRQRAAEAEIAVQQQRQSAQWQQQQEQQVQQQIASQQREKNLREQQAREERVQQARNQALAEQQQRQAEVDRRAVAERQRQQAEAREQQEMARRQQLEQANQQAMLQARQQQEAQQREQLEQSRRQAELQARQMAAEQRQREHEARQQQAEVQRRQAEEGQRRQQMQEAQERAQAARQQQMEEAARQRQQAEAAHQREQQDAAARQHAEHAREKHGK